jgi:hypothetical protein
MRIKKLFRSYLEHTAETGVGPKQSNLRLRIKNLFRYSEHTADTGVGPKLEI